MAKKAFVYGLFGAAATGANLGVQALMHLGWAPAPGTPDAAYWVALMFGTGAGLVIKYLLDKRWIFHDRSAGLATHSTKFARYALMGGATTVIFWAMQTGFFMIWQTQTMLMVGGASGLIIGYLVKYQLDKRFVFDRPGGPA